MKLWPNKRIGFTAVGFILTALLCWLLVAVLKTEEGDPVIIAMVTLAVGWCLLAMVLAMGKAATLREEFPSTRRNWWS